MHTIVSKIKEAAVSHMTLSLILCGLFGGFVNGLLGAGSGIIFIFALNALFSGENKKHPKEVFALSLGAVFFVTLFSVFFYALNGRVSFSEASSYILPAAAGGLAGAALLDRISTFWLKLIFSIIIIYSGFSML